MDFISLENISVVFGLLYIVFLIRENIIAWVFGFLASVCISYLFFTEKIYLQAILNFYYVLSSIYGYYIWQKKDASQKIVTKIHDIPLKKHGFIIGSGMLIGLLLYVTMEYVIKSNYTLLDSIIFAYSAIATVMQVKKILSSWIYWIFINFLTVILCLNAQLYSIAILMIIYIILAIIGYIKWKKQ